MSIIGKIFLGVVGILGLLFIALVLGAYTDNSNRNSNTNALPEGETIEFLYIGEGDTFVAKIKDVTSYRKYKFSGEQPKVGKYRIVGVGKDKRELIPISDTTEASK
jgi:hypothetical protein